MAYLTTYTRDQYRQIAVDEYNEEATIPVATDEGSGVGAFFDGDSLVATTQQRQIIYVALVSRLDDIPPNPDGTPNPDVDSFCSPFIGDRLGQQSAYGAALFSCPSNVATQVVVLVGTVVTTNPIGGGTQILYAVIADTTNPNYNAVLNGYVINPGSRSVLATIQCLTPGVVGNAQAGQINSLYAGPGANVAVPASISTVSNPNAFTTGSPYETDAQYKARFKKTVMTSRAGTYPAMVGALLAIAAGVTYSYADRKDANGNTVSAYFTIVIAMLGQTNPTSAQLIAQAELALEGNPPAVPPTRPAGISYQVVGPTILTVGVGATITVAPGYTPATVAANCTTAVSQYIASIGLPGTAATTVLAYLRIAAILYAVPGVAQVDTLVLSEGGVNYTTDLTATYSQLFAAGAMNFTTM